MHFFQWYIETKICVHSDVVLELNKWNTFAKCYINNQSIQSLILGRDDEARKVLRRFRDNSVDIESEIEGYRTANREHKSVNFLESLKQPKICRKLLLCSTLFFFQVFSGEKIRYYIKPQSKE